MKRDDLEDLTVLCHAGLDPASNHGVVNPPVYHASTILFPTVAELEAGGQADLFEHTRYGRIGTPTSRAFEKAVAALEGGSHAVSMPSGLNAIATTLLAFLRQGDHILVTDSVYGPTRAACTDLLARFGVETQFYDPTIGGAIRDLMRPETKLVFVESPGSLTFEVQDVPAIAEVARKAGAKVVMDNTWATPLYFKPFRHGVDVSIHSATKYIVGHSDAMLGIVVCGDREDADLVKKAAVVTGTAAGPDDVYLGQRGLRSMGVRLQRHWENGVTLAQWLQGRPEVARVLHPALHDDPGHALWKRDFLGASGLFAVELKPCTKAAVAAMLDGLELFGMGYSWGGFESLALPADPRRIRTASRWTADGPLIRFHAGLEDARDLIRDLEAGFRRLADAA
ncbi:cystathionine beta-lyase [Arenibaculum sp.]|jgi:cystathionine beta-lyase|uniref:cystathionine beta-lyase n=1 Tax=Arenibaculum sp. TaxID=2865862 RepID=UPI002E0E6F0D|nr:cystathionine beta-lyase [Arenibaculum sp.]